MEAREIFADYSKCMKLSNLNFLDNFHFRLKFSHPVAVGNVFIGRVTSVLQDVFHVAVNESEYSIKMELKDLQSLFWLPENYEKFLLVTEDGIFRATRIPTAPSSIDSTRFMNIYFLDTGESYIIEIPNTKLHQITFEMPAELMQVPAIAIKCRLNEVFVEDNVTHYSEFFLECSNQKHEFEVVKVEKDALIVNIFLYNESNDDQDETSSELSLQVDKSSDKMFDQLTKRGIGAVTKESMTAAQLNILDEEPLNTDSALIAVQGFETHDDDRLCKFYNPTIGGCFKGGRCKQIHLSEIKDGTCRDREELYYNSILEEIPLPKVQSIIRIEIMSLSSIRRIYCRYRKNVITRNKYSIDMLIKHMNKPEEVKTFKPVKQLPSLKQLVLLSVNGIFCRGRVESLPDSDQNVDVFLVDFGRFETVKCRNLYHWSVQFNYLAFQSFEMEIANIEPFKINTDEEAAMKRMEELVKESRNCLLAEIFDNLPVIRCTLFNLKNQDIGVRLVSEGLLAPRQITKELSANPFCIPG